jgi:tripartite-type tricarboxylate transporter receptor subunit TctC
MASKKRVPSLLIRSGLVATLAALALLLGACGGRLGEVAGSSGDGAAELPDEISFIVPNSAGGGFDTTARTLAPYLEEYLPEGTTVTVKNEPGGNGAIAINEVMSAEPNGGKIMIYNIPGHLVPPLTGEADYDLNEVEWLGLSAQTTYLATVSPATGVENLEDLKELTGIDVTSGGATATSTIGALIALENLGFDTDKINVVAHKGSPEAILSAIRGDTDFAQFPYGTLREYVVGSDDLTPLWVYSEERLEELPEIPTFEEVGGDPDLLDVISLYRPIGTTPGTPPEVLETLRGALAEAMNDPQLLKEMEEGALEPQYEDAETTAEIVRNSSERMREYRQLFE